MLTRYEHFNGTHWDGCRYGGHVGAGHTSINTHVISIARALGAAGSLQEVKLGPRDPNRAVDKESNPNQRGDGVLGNWTRPARRMVFDGTTITAVQFRKGMLGARWRAARTSPPTTPRRRSGVPRPRRARPTTTTS